MNTPLAVDLNSPGSYLNWSIFTVSVANLVLIAVMVAIFGAALLLPFPGRRAGAKHSSVAPGSVDQNQGVDEHSVHETQAASDSETTPGQSPATAFDDTALGDADPGDPRDADMWTAKAR